MMKLDFTGHSPAARARTSRDVTQAIVLHRFAADSDADGITTFEEAVDFFVRDPEGIATVALGGPYAEKLATIKRWREEGVPAAYQGRGFFPYHFAVAPDGRVARMLPLDVRGAHAGAWNWRSVGIAVLGRTDLAPPPAAQVAALVELLKDVLAMYPQAKILSHDETLAIAGQPLKGCTGRFFPLAEVREAARK